MAESLALGHGKKRLQDKAYLFVAEERTFRTSWSNLSTSSSSSYTRLTFFICKSSLLCFWLFLGMSCCCHIVSRLLMPFSGFALKWSLSSTTTTLGTFYTMISHFCRSWHRNCCTAIQKLSKQSLVLNNSIAYMGSWTLLPFMRSWPYWNSKVV